MEGELLAIKEGLQLCLQEDWQKIIITTDCKLAAHYIISSPLAKSSLTNLLQQCRELLKLLAGAKLEYEERSQSILW